MMVLRIGRPSHTMPQHTQITPEAEVVVAILRAIVLDRTPGSVLPPRTHAPFAWNRLQCFLRYHELGPLAYEFLRAGPGPRSPHLMAELLAARHVYTANSARLWKEYLRISQALQREGIPMVPLKGIALLKDVYPQPSVRPMVDIDLLVRPDDLKRAETILRGLDYTIDGLVRRLAFWRERGAHVIYRYGSTARPSNLLVELHWRLDYPRTIHPILPTLWERIRHVDIDQHHLTWLSPEDSLFSLTLHKRRETARPFTLKGVLDVCLLLKKYHDTIDWDYVLREAARGGMQSALYFTLWQASAFTERPIPRRVWEALTVPTYKRRLIQRAIANQTFAAPLHSKPFELFLRMHLLLYDTWREPTALMLNMAPEEFARYFNLEPYSQGTMWRYRYRWLYVPGRALLRRIPFRSARRHPSPHPWPQLAQVLGTGRSGHDG